jgi:indole-3-glycerol phosphate synthase
MSVQPDMLGAIYEKRRQTLARDQASEPQEVLEERARERFGGRRSLRSALEHVEDVGIIGEIKFASPSRGTIIENQDPAAIAQRLEQAGVDAISVVTEEHFFGGGRDVLERVRAHTKLPVLRKDFLTSTYEVVQSAAYGADAILLIVAGLSDEQIAALSKEAERWSLDPLLEVHDETDLRRALSFDVSLVGINNRDLRTFEVSLQVSGDLLPLVPPHMLAISESGISAPSEVLDLARRGARGCLIGEALLRATDPRAFVGACHLVVAG